MTEEIGIAVIQRSIPHYRFDFFERLAEKSPGLVILHSSKVTGDGLVQQESFSFPNLSFPIIDFRYLCYQGIFWHVLNKKYKKIIIGPELRMLSNFLVLLFGAFSCTKIISWTHGYDVHKTKRNIFYLADRVIKTFIFKKSEKILLYTNFNLPELIERGVDPGKIIILNNTINEKPYVASAKKIKPQKLRCIERQTRPSKHTLTFIGRLTKSKNPDLVLELAKRLICHYPDLRVFMIGDGPQREALEGLTKNFELQRHVYFLGTITDPDMLSPYMLLTDFVVLPGAVGLSLVHSNIYGIPFVTLKNSAHSPEIAYLENNRNGYAAENIQDMERWLVESFSCPEKIRRMRRNCRKLIAEKVNIDSMVARFVSALQSEK